MVGKVSEEVGLGSGQRTEGQEGWKGWKGKEEKGRPRSASSATGIGKSLGKLELERRGRWMVERAFQIGRQRIKMDCIDFNS